MLIRSQLLKWPSHICLHANNWQDVFKHLHQLSRLARNKHEWHAIIIGNVKSNLCWSFDVFYSHEVKYAWCESRIPLLSIVSSFKFYWQCFTYSTYITKLTKTTKDKFRFILDRWLDSNRCTIFQMENFGPKMKMRYFSTLWWIHSLSLCLHSVISKALEFVQFHSSYFSDFSCWVVVILWLPKQGFVAWPFL